jgi:hypothetical protein
MSKNFTVIGNCQSDSLVKFLECNTNFINKFKYIFVKNIHLMNEKDLDDMYSNILPLLDLVIIQPISENYKNNYKYSTKSILSNINSSCISILIPSLYFDFYYPFLTYIYDQNNQGWKLGTPYDYHDKNIIKLYIDNKDNIDIKLLLEKYNEVFNNSNIFNDMYFNKSLAKNINNLKERESKYIKYCNDLTHIINSSDFILNNYKKKLLFYAVNHPTKYLFRYISDSIFIILNMHLEEYPDQIDPLKALVIPIYKCIQKQVEFNVDDYKDFMHYDIILDKVSVINSYIEAYNNVDVEILKNNF